MRKTTAVAVSAIRRSSSRGRSSKQQQQQQGQQEENVNVNNNNKEEQQQPLPPSPPNHQQQQKQQRKQSTTTNNPDDVAALTAKNYRLAKELSEIRVRHREECKKQTRLSMENMNMSSKYRDCLQQIALLKKEVAFYQRRVEVLAKNTKGGLVASSSSSSSPETTPPTGSQDNVISSSPSSSSPGVNTTTATNNNTVASSSSSTPSPRLPAHSALVTPRKAKDTANAALADVVAEMNRMDQILAEHAKKSSTSTSLMSLENNNKGGESDSTAVVSVAVQQPLQQRAESSSPPVASATMTTASTTPESTTSSLTVSPPEQLQLRPAVAALNTPAGKLVSSDDFETDTVDLMEDVDDEPARVVLPPDYLVNADKETKEGDECESSNNDNSSKSDNSNIKSSYFPHSATPKFRFNEEYPGDIVASVRHKKAPRNAIERLDETKEDEEQGSSSQQQQQQQPSSSSPPLLPISSIDAFEASFHTPFPDSFASPKEGNNDSSELPVAPDRDVREDPYNPFSQSPGPASYNWRGSAAATAGGESIIYSAPIGGSDPPGRVRTSQKKKLPKSPLITDASAKGLLPKFNLLMSNSSNKDVPVIEESVTIKSLSSLANITYSRSPLSGSGAFLLQTPPPPPAAPSSSPPGPKILSSSVSSSNNDSYSTPPHLVNHDPSTGSGSEHLKRPEKTGFEGARARREKVLQPRSATSQKSQPTPTSSTSAPPPLRSSSPPQMQSTPPPSDEGIQEQQQVSVLDPRSREAILANARSRMSASTYSTPPSKSPPSSFSENNVNKSALWSESLSSVYDDDGDIPLRSSLTKNMEMRIRVVDNNYNNTNNKNSSINMSNNLHSTQPKRSPWQDEDDAEQEEDPSNSPRLKHRLATTMLAATNSALAPPPVQQQRRLEAAIMSSSRF